MRLRVWASTAVAVAVVGLFAGCGKSGDDTAAPPAPGGGGGGVGALGGAPSTSAGAGSPVVAVTTTKPPVATKPATKALTCDQLRNAKLGSPTVKYNGYNDYIPLADGIWSGEDGVNVSLRECGLGDLDGDGAADGLASIVMNSGGTGQFYSLAYWRNVSGQPVFTALLDLDDRTPVEKITISGNRATVVILTRTPDLPAAAVNLRRTAIYKVSGAKLVEVSHTDTAYTPS